MQRPRRTNRESNGYKAPWFSNDPRLGQKSSRRSTEPGCGRAAATKKILGPASGNDALAYGPAVANSPRRFDPLGRWLKARLRAAALLVLPICAGLATSNCSSHSGPDCQSGQLCACGNGPECFLGCYADGCNLECGNTANSCGSVCGNQCAATCHDTNDCSSSCGDGCSLDCHNTASCGAQCGVNCAYACHDTTRCGVRVGPASTVSCDHVASCTVECAGACTVTCTNVDSCAVTCAPGHTYSDNGNGTITCG